MNPTKKTFDLAALRLEDNAKIELKHPTTGEKLGMFLIIAGKDSATFKAAMRDRYAKRVADAKLGADINPSMDAVDEENLSLLTRCVTGMENIVLNGEELEFTPDNVRMLLAGYPWIYEQVDTEVGNRGNFLRS